VEDMLDLSALDAGLCADLADPILRGTYPRDFGPSTTNEPFAAIGMG
jgi:hypothetical protein